MARKENKKEVKDRRCITISFGVSDAVERASEENFRSFSSQVEVWVKEGAVREGYLKKK